MGGGHSCPCWPFILIGLSVDRCGGPTLDWIVGENSIWRKLRPPETVTQLTVPKNDVVSWWFYLIPVCIRSRTGNSGSGLAFGLRSLPDQERCRSIVPRRLSSPTLLLRPAAHRQRNERWWEGAWRFWETPPLMAWIGLSLRSSSALYPSNL